MDIIEFTADGGNVSGRCWTVLFIIFRYDLALMKEIRRPKQDRPELCASADSFIISHSATGLKMKTFPDG
jgi:hypothetical protein